MQITTDIMSLDRLRREATAAARVYTDVNDACPYPFGSVAGHAFKQYFLEARQRAGLAHPTQPQEAA